MFIRRTPLERYRGHGEVSARRRGYRQTVGSRYAVNTCLYSVLVIGQARANTDDDNAALSGIHAQASGTLRHAHSDVCFSCAQDEARQLGYFLHPRILVEVVRQRCQGSCKRRGLKEEHSFGNRERRQELPLNALMAQMLGHCIIPSIPN